MTSSSALLPSALAAARLSALLAPENADAAAALAASAARHVARARQARQAQGPLPVALVFPSTLGDQELTPTPPPVGVVSARKYVHKGPTRSLVLNAFLHAVGQLGLVLPSTPVLNEQTLAPRLLECTRRHWAHLMMSAGDVDAALRLEAEVPPITNELAARFHLQRAVGVTGEIGEIAREYQQHRSLLGDPERDDREGGCIMATFAGRLVAHLDERLGPHVVDDVRAALRRILAEGAPVRRR
jgi:hypothetical protein